MADVPVSARPFGSAPSSPSSRPADGWMAATIAALCAAAAATFVYGDVLHGYFWSDDFSWLFLLHDASLSRFLLTPIGGHTVVARNAVIALLDALAGLDPVPWFATVLVTHALNVVLLARIVWLVTGSALLAGVGALAWGTCPAAAGTLEWYAVYAQVAATTCLLVAFGRVAVRVRAGADLGGGDLAFVAVWLMLSSLFFGTAIAVAIAWPAVALLLAPGSMRGAGRVAGVLAVSALVFLLYTGLQLVAAQAYDTPMIPLQAAHWLAERTLPAVIAFAQLLRVGVTSLLMGAWWLPGPRSDVFSWAVLALAGLVWGVAVLRTPARERALLLAFALLAVLVYASIAAARGPLAGLLARHTSAQVGATLRYHYVPQAFLAIVACVALSRVPGRRAALAGIWGVALLGGVLRYDVPIELHGETRAEVDAALDELDAVLAAPTGDTIEIPNRPLAAMGWLPNTTTQAPGLAALFVIVHPSDVVDGRVVRFVEPAAAWRESARQRGGRTATLLVAPAA